MQDGETKKTIKLAKQFDENVKKIISAIKDGVELFTDLINGRIDLKDIFDKLVDALNALPDKVILVTLITIVTTMHMHMKFSIGTVLLFFIFLFTMYNSRTTEYYQSHISCMHCNGCYNAWNYSSNLDWVCRSYLIF